MVEGNNFWMRFGGQAVVEGPGVSVRHLHLLVEPLVGLD